MKNKISVYGQTLIVKSDESLQEALERKFCKRVGFDIHLSKSQGVPTGQVTCTKNGSVQWTDFSYDVRDFYGEY